MKGRLAALILLVSVLGTHSAIGLEIPLLTWEQGKSQSVVLGGPTASNNWRVNLYSESGFNAPFKASKINSAGYRVFTIDLPANLPEGSYIITTKGPGSPTTSVAQVLVVPLLIYEVPRAPIDLLALLLSLGLLLSFVISKRSRKVRIPFHRNLLSDITKLATGDELGSARSLKFNSLEKKRAEIFDSMTGGTFKSVLFLDANVLLNKRRSLYWVLPSVCALLGCVLSVIHLSDSNFFTPTDLVLITIIITISFFDVFSGFSALITYLALSFALQDGLGIRELVLNVSVAGMFVIPALFLMYGILLTRPKELGVLRVDSLTSFLGVLYLPWVYFLARSIGQVDDFSLFKIGALIAISIGLMLFKKHITLRFLNTSIKDSEEVQIQNSISHRIVSPSAVLVFGLLMLSVFFNWTQNLGYSLMAAIAWSLPLWATILRFESPFFLRFQILPRSEFIEIIVVGFGICVAFELMRSQPLLVQDRSSVLLSVMSIPLILHGLYVLVADSGRAKERELE